MNEIEVEAQEVKPEEQQPEPREQKADDSSKYLIPIGPGGKIMARNNSELMRYCGAIVSGGGVPERFDTPQKLFAALMFVRDLKLPDTAIRQVASIHGTIMTFGDLPLAMVQNSGELEYFAETWFTKEYKVISFENQNLDDEAFGAECKLKRKDSTGDKPQSFSFTLSDAKKAGLYPSSNPAKPWAKYTKMMLRYKARSIALKSVFADKISGVGIAEYDADVMPDARDVTPPTEERTASINDILNKRRHTAKAGGDSNGQEVTTNN